jgi:nitroreductase
MKFNLTDTLNLIKHRRSISPAKMSTRKVHREQIEAMIEAANWAPTHGLTEPWRFKVFSGDALLKLMTFYAENYKNSTPPENFLQDKYDAFIRRAHTCTYVTAVWMKRQETQVIPEIEEIMAVACAVQNFSLVAAAYGIGCFWGTGNIAYSPKMHEFMGLGPHDRFLGLLYTGYPEGEWPQGKRHTHLTKTEWIES